MNAQNELLKVIARIRSLKKQGMESAEEIHYKKDEIFPEHQSNIERLRVRAARGDAKAQAAYMALLRGRRTLE
jgi:hypothetical protein